MPDFGVQQPDLPQLPQAPATLLPDSSASVAPPVLSPMDRYNQATQNANSNLPAWAQDSNSQFVTPFKTNLDQTLRYSDPNIGFDPNDSNLEDKYANAHWLKTFGNNILQGGARFLGGAAETIGTIPLAIDAAVNNDFSKLYDNDLTNGINSWLNTLNTTLPIYQTNFERDHPVLKYLDPLKPGSFLGGVGGAFNNFGFMAGAIAGSMVEDAVITAATGGVGFFPGLAANGAQLTKMLGRAGRAIASAPEDIKAAFSVTRYSEEEAAASAARVAAQGTTDTAPSIVPAGSEVSTTLRPNGEGINSQNLQNFDEVSSSQKVDELQQAIKNNANYYKIRDAVKYNLAMLSSATSQAAFNAADVYKNGVDQLKQQYLEDNGTVPVDDALDNIKKISHQSANVTMGANIALLDIMNRINWGSLFKPTTTAFDNAITGWGGSITRSTVEKDATTAGNTIYNVVSKAPENTIGKVLLNGEKILNKSYIGIDQVAQQGGLFAINQGAMDYNLRKYNAQNRGELVDGMQSFMTGIDKTFNTNEGWDAMMGGFIGGIFGTGLMNKIMEGRGQTTAEKQLKIQADLLNHYSFNGTFENKMQEAAVQSSLASDYKDHVENQDMFNAKNIKHEMLYNWVASGIRANSFDQRMEELDAVRDLQGKSFQDYWGKEDNLQNRSDINSFLDDIQKKANGIKTNYNRIDLLSQNPYDPIKESADHEAFESYKDQLALNLSKSDDYRERIQSMKDDLYKVNPLLDIQKAINLTSISGMRETLNGIDKSRTDINEQIRVAKETKMGQDFTSDLVNKGKALDKLFNKLQPLINDTKVDDYGNVIESGFNGKDYTDVLQNLYDLHDGGDFTNSKYVNRFTKPNVVVDEQGNASVSNHDKLAENLQSLQDIYKLGEANLNVQRYYNFLRKGVGATEYSNRLKSLSIEDLKKYMGKEGTIKSPDEIKQDIEEETRFDTPEPENMEEASKDERDQLTATAKKVVNGDALSDDEQKLSQEKPTRFAHEVKIQQAVQEKMTERFGEPTTDNQIKPKTGNAIKVSNLFGMFSQDKGDIKNRTNLYNAIFKNKDGVFNKLTAAYSKTDVKDTTYTKIPNTQLYRSTFGEEITISHDGKPIGILRPQDSMWLDAEGKRSIYDMTKEEFSGITGHPITNYDNFMGELKAYQDAYNKFKDKLSKGNIESSDYDLIKQYFDLSINTGASVQNRYTIANVGGKFHVMNPEGNVEQRFDKVSQAQDWIKNNNKNLSRFDTVIKDLNYKPKGTVLLSFTDDVELGGGSAKNNRNIHIVNEADLTQEQLGKVHLFINNNKDALSKNANRYALIVPIDGEYKNKAVIFARNAETQQDERGNFFSSIKDAANGVINGDKLTELADKLNKEFFFANQDRTVKQTYIHLSFSDNGDLILDINNPNSKSYNRITLDKAEIQNSGSYGDLMKNIQSKISDEGQKDKAFGKLAVFLGEDSLKRQIPDDEDIKHLSQVENKMSAATTPSIFTNYNINFTPKGYAESAGNKVETKPVEDNTNKSILPQELAGAKPRYSYQDKNFKLNFENDVDKAAYITAQTKRSNRDADYLKFAMDNTGLSEPEVRALGSQIRAKIKETAKDSNEESIDVPKTYKPKVVEKDVVDATKAVTDEYKQKRAELQKEFNDSLTPEEVRIKKEVRQNPALASDTAALSKIANASTADIESYSKKASIYNEQFRIYDAIQKQKLENPTKTDTAIYAKTKAGIHTIAKDLFGLNKEQAQSVSDIFDLNANAWAKRTGNSVADYYKQLGFKSQLEEGNSDDILNQIIGEGGVRKLDDHINIQNNLVTARDMDSKGMYSRSQIREATGWEKSGDSKWRYEINDGKLTDRAEGQFGPRMTKNVVDSLKNIYNSPELYDAYPFLKRIKVIAKIEGDESEGSYDGFNTIRVNASDKSGLLSTIIHEVQHAIQTYEGFAKGGNPSTVFDNIIDAYNHRGNVDNYTVEQTSRRILGKEEDAYVIKNDTGLYLSKVYKTQTDAQEALDNYKKSIDNISKSYNSLVEKKTRSYDAYKQLAGEVEARNAETRSKMTPEQRANNTLVSTEDVDEESKIYLNNSGSNLSASSKTINDIQDITKYLGLEYKKSGANFGGFVKNGIAGKELYNRVMDVIKEKGLEEKVGARLDLQNNTIQFYNRDKQGTLFQNAYHGSPKTFDKFSSNNIGSGEGSQYFGWGHYFTDYISRARTYAAEMRNHDTSLLEAIKKTGIDDNLAYRIELNTGMSKTTSLKAAYLNELKSSRGYGEPEKLPSQDILDKLATIDMKQFSKKGKRNMYTAEIPGDINNGMNWLHWLSDIKPEQVAVIKGELSKGKYNLDNEKINSIVANVKGENVYNSLAKELGSEEKASKALLAAGIDGIKVNGDYEENTMSKKFDYTVFDENAININDHKLYQGSANEAKGAYNKLNNVIYALKSPDVTTPLHELAHSWEKHLNDEERNQVLEWAKETGSTDTGWTRDTSERFGSGFEKYLAEGKAPTKGLETIFKKFAKWMGDVITKVKSIFGDKFELNDNMRSIYAKMIDSDLVKNDANIETKTKEAVTPEEVKDNKPLTNEANIDYDTALDGSSKIYVKDNNGKTIPNPNNELDNSFKLDEAKQFIKDYNDKLENKEEIKAPLEPEKVPEEQPQPEKTPEEQPQPEEQSDRVIKPLNEDEKTDYGKISKIQQGIKDGFYEDKIRKGELTETQVKDIMVSAGLRKTVVDGMVFRIENPDLLKALKDGIPEGVNISYLRSDINGAIKDGRFGEAIRNGEIPTDKAKGILKYFNIDDSKFKDDFEAVEKQKAENLAPQESKPITSEDMDFINVLKQHLDDLNGIYGNIIKDKIDSEDYTGAMDDIREFFTDDIKQAKKIFNNDDVYKAFLDATDLKEGDTSTADEFANKHSDIFSPEEVPEKQAINDKYVTYKEKDENGNVVERPAKVVENNGFTSLIETPDGKQFDRVTDQLKPTTKDEFDLLKPKDPKPTSMDNAKYSAGDKVVYGQDKQEFTIVSAETRVNDKGVNETFYNTEEGPMISEDGIRNMARETKVSKILDIKKGQEKRQKVLERIAKRFTQLFPDIKYEIGNFDFNAPARFNKGIVELNVGYNDVRYTRGEINEARYNDILNTPWLKRESVAHEFMHPFVAALKMSNEVLYNNLIKELQKTQPDILAHVDKLIKGGTYDESNRNDEALTIYLGKSITEAFTKDGELNTEYAKTRSKSLVKRFFDWINNMMDYLTGKRSKVSLEDFVKNANTDLDAQRNDIRSAIKDVPSLQELYSKEHNNDLIKTIKYIKRVGAEAFDEDGSINYEKYQKGIDDIIDDLNKHQDAKEQKGANLKATIHERPKLENPVYKVEVNGEDRFIQREIGNDFDQWHEVTKNGEAWENKDRTDVSFTKQDMLDNLAKEIKGKNTIDREDVSNVVDKVSDLLQQKNTGRFEFIIQPNEDTDVRFDQTDNNHIKVYVDPSFSNDISATDTMLRYGQRDIVDNEAAEEFKNLVQRNYYKGSNSKETSNEIGVSALNPFMRLQDVSDFMVKQLYDGNTNSDAGLKIVYSNPELDAIDQLEAYMDLTNEDADKIRKTIVNRLKQLKDTADVRLKSDVLKTQYAIVNRLALDENSTDFVLKYIERAGIGINLAWRKFNEIRQDLKDPNMTSAKLSRLNKEIDVVKQLVSFYDDFSKLYNNYDEYFKDEDLVKFAKSVSNWQRIRENMNETSINLAVKWMLPYAEKHNEYITKEGFTDPKYLVSEETLYNNFKFGTDKDVNFITYNLGANVTSRDPVNAIFTNIVADMLSVNNIKIVNDSFDINDGYVKFLKDNNLSNTNNKAQEDFYKKNYLRKAEILQSVYNKEKGEYEDKYVEKWALHQEFKFDQYQKDYAIERDKYKDPRDGDQAELFAEKLNKWQEDNKYGRSEKYRNNDYTKLQNDSYFKLLSHHYDVNNMKYGENHLLFGIVPQKYDVSMLDKLKNFISGAKTAKGRDEIKDNALRNIAGIKKDNTSENLDDTKFRIIKSNLNQLKSDDNIDLNLHSSIIDMVTEATNYGSLKDVQYNVENVRALIDGNDHFNMPGRKIGKEDFEANIRSLQQVRQAKRDLKPLQALKDAGQPYNEELYNKLTARVEKGAAPQKFWDRFATTVKRSDTNRLNEQLTQFINDSFYGEAVEEAKIGNISLNKAAHYVSMYTSINNMAFNTVAGVSNVVIGDVQMMIEAHGGKYFNKKDLAWATKDYFANMANYIGDMKNPIKSKDTQISFLLDAIQGEVLDEFGNRISGNISRRMFNAGSLFFFTTVGEHQIQTIGMKAMLRAQKVQTNDGKTISLYDAFQADASGRYKLRNDTNFSSDDLQHFIRQLHGVNRSLNGNYSDLHKSVLQRKWYGTLALKFRKYIYESFRSRYSGERVDFEKNTVEHGYMNFFLKDYLYKNFRDLPWSKKFNFAENYNNLTPNQKYFVRKSGMEFGMFLGLLVTTSALFGSTHDKDKKDLSTVDKTLLLYSLRLQNDLGMFHVQMPSEAQRQIQSPTASMTSIVALTNFLGQLYKPTEEYQQKGSGYDAGDSKLAAKFKKLLPVISKFPIDVDSKLGYFDMVNQNIQGVSRKQSH